MGVRGLTTYIAENSDLFLKPYELSNCYLVVDGNNIASHLFNWVSKSDSAFGGDYDEYYKTVKDFFVMLKKCKVTPIILFDGGYEKKKIKTVLSRAANKIYTLRVFCKHFSNMKFFSLFAKQTFFDVMEDLDIFCIQCDLEADVEIAALAKALNCPVLSYDSDFYIYDVLYIPFSSVHTEITREKDSNNKVKEYVKCLIYDVNNFLNEFDNLDKSMLPIIATLLGNDYYDSSALNKFFSHVIIPKMKNKSYTQRKIHGVLHWLKKESVESATELILSHVENKHAKKIQRVIDSNIEEYTKMTISCSVTSGVNKFLKKKKISGPNFKEDNKIDLPPIIMDLYHQCRIQKHIIDMITLRTYFTSLQIENVHHQSSHSPSLRLIAAIYAILDPYLQGNSKPLKAYLTVKNHYAAIKVENNVTEFLNNCNLENILKSTVNYRLKLLYDIIGVDENDMKIISKFSEPWSVFVLAFLYWVKKLNSSITHSHIHALILMAISNQVLQKNVGYYRNNSKFTKKRGTLLSELSKTELIVGKEGEDDFNELLKCVTMYECLLLQQVLIPWRQTTESGRGQSYCISVIHLFACFQSSLYHIMQLNALLNYPLPHLKISDFYSGTLLFNFYISINPKPSVDKFGLKLFERAPNVTNLYKHMYEILCGCSEKKPLPVKKGKKKRKKGKKEEDREDDVFVFYEEEDEENDDYNDENNPYAVLRIKKEIRS